MLIVYYVHVSHSHTSFLYFKGLHSSMQYSMMIAGHTKFEPDWHFGIWKLKWRNASAESMNQVMIIIVHTFNRFAY